MKRGKIIVIVAPSGTGKSTLIKDIMHEISDLSWSVSCTTRPRRNGEIHGKDYFFITEKEFLLRKERGDFIEWAKVHSNYYGTLKSFVDDGLAKGMNLLFDLDVQGCDQVKSIYKEEAKIIFIEPPSVEDLEQRLKSRATDDLTVINERLANAKKELVRKNDFDFLVTNDDFKQAKINLNKIIKEILE